MKKSINKNIKSAICFAACFILTLLGTVYFSRIDDNTIISGSQETVASYTDYGKDVTDTRKGAAYSDDSKLSTGALNEKVANVIKDIIS